MSDNFKHVTKDKTIMISAGFKKWFMIWRKLLIHKDKSTKGKFKSSQKSLLKK